MRWTVNRARDWYYRQLCLVGCNFLRSTAIKQLEMWQEDTYDTNTVARELGLVEELGFKKEPSPNLAFLRAPILAPRYFSERWHSVRSARSSFHKNISGSG